MFTMEDSLNLSDVDKELDTLIRLMKEYQQDSEVKIPTLQYCSTLTNLLHCKIDVINTRARMAKRK